jgi:hypothetical protein
MPAELVLGAGQQALRPLPAPRMIRSDVIRNVVEDQTESLFSQFRPGRGQPGRAAQPSIDDVVAHTIRRADHVFGAEVREGGAIPGVDLGVSSAIRRPARLCSHTRPSTRRCRRGDRC